MLDYREAAKFLDGTKDLKNIYDNFKTYLPYEELDKWKSMWDKFSGDVVHLIEDGNLYISLPIPGIKKEEISIEFNSGENTEVKITLPEVNRTARGISLDGNKTLKYNFPIRVDTAQAKVQDGILYLTFSPLKKSSKKVEIL